jgi:cysteine synthase A
VTGVGRYLKERKPGVWIAAVEPDAYPHGIQGIGAGFEPPVFDRDICDEALGVSYNEAIAERRALAETEGIFAGISSGAALAAAKRIAQRAEYEGKNIVVMLPDTGERYLSVLV